MRLTIVLGIAFCGISAYADFSLGVLPPQQPAPQQVQPRTSESTTADIGVDGRSVAGGDYLYTATADDASSDMATFKARQAAVRILVNDCGVAHKNTQFDRGEIYQRPDGGWVATEIAYILIDDCKASKAAKDKRSFEGASLAKDQALYTKMLEPKPTVSENEIEEQRLERQKSKDTREELVEKMHAQQERQNSLSADQDEMRAQLNAMRNEPKVRVVTVHSSPSYDACAAELERLYYLSMDGHDLFGQYPAKVAECKKLRNKEQVTADDESDRESMKWAKATIRKMDARDACLKKVYKKINAADAAYRTRLEQLTKATCTDTVVWGRSKYIQDTQTCLSDEQEDELVKKYPRPSEEDCP